jgi:hypothetical protein
MNDTMIEDIKAPPALPLTLEGLQRQLLALRERVEDLEDLRDFHAAEKENAGRAAIPWEEVKKDLDLE